MGETKILTVHPTHLLVYHYFKFIPLIVLILFIWSFFQIKFPSFKVFAFSLRFKTFFFECLNNGFFHLQYIFSNYIIYCADKVFFNVFQLLTILLTLPSIWTLTWLNVDSDPGFKSWISFLTSPSPVMWLPSVKTQTIQKSMQNIQLSSFNLQHNIT